MSVPGADESWMDNFSAAEVLQQYGFDPNVTLTSEGKFEKFLTVPTLLMYFLMVQTVHLLQTGALRIRRRVARILLTKGSS